MNNVRLLACLTLLSMTGCDALFRRPTLSESEFMARYLKEIPPSSVKHVYLQQQGGVGGRSLVARVEFLSADALSAISRLHRERVLDVNDPDGIAKEYLDAAFRSALGPAPPAWATIPSATNIVIYTDSLDGRFRKIFTFDTLPVVFVFGGED